MTVRWREQQLQKQISIERLRREEVEMKSEESVSGHPHHCKELDLFQCKAAIRGF